jgi:phage shock protein E
MYVPPHLQKDNHLIKRREGKCYPPFLKSNTMKNLLQNATIVDVRTPEEFSGSHYPAAINIPLSELPQRLDEIKQLKQPVVAYCRSGNRSGMAVSILKQSGLSNVYNGGALNDLLQQKNN